MRVAGSRCAPWKVAVALIGFGVVGYIVLSHGQTRSAVRREPATSHDDDRNIGRLTDHNDTNPAANLLLIPNLDLIEKFVDVVLLFTKAKGNGAMRDKLVECVKTLTEGSSVPVRLHVIGDSESQRIAQTAIAQDVVGDRNKQLEVVTHSVQKITSTLHNVVSDMQEHFSYKPGAYYSDALFFLSLAIHRVFPQQRVIMIDIDVKFDADVWQLHQEFQQFGESAVIGVAYEQQPVYRHVFQVYRQAHPGTKVGSPPADGGGDGGSGGVPGFNSGVLLLDLERMRLSETYNRMLNAAVVDELVRRYSFKGHLGDQDFFTLVSLEHPDLFHVLSCGWNRQLCQWWRNHGYQDVFDAYYQCNETVKIYHGNCNTPISPST